jgi:hypothetical protein
MNSDSYTDREKTMVELPAPLFRDPIYDCPTDPTIIWNRQEEQWYLFYTQRRATDTSIGVSWVHGTDIGVATSRDGAKWLYRGTLEGLEVEHGRNTFWAPEILWGLGCYHMYVSYVQGIPEDWDYPRKILHYTSQNLWDWSYQGQVDLKSGRVIDACVYETAPNQYKMWYKDEEKDSRIYAAVSEDLYNWEVLGEEIGDCAQEGPNVFELGEKKWLVSDFWDGLAVYCSDDFAHWVRKDNILTESGSRAMDKGLGHHADVLVKDGRAYIFYFCQPFAYEKDPKPADFDSLSPRVRNLAVVQAAELVVRDGKLCCDRDAKVTWTV